MESEPLGLLARYRREGLVEFLRLARGRGLRLGVFSDYPAGPKLTALGVSALFDVAVSAQDPEVCRFKPHPRGLAVTARRLDVEPVQTVYIGDRPETDAVAARAAGMACVILAGSTPRRDEGWATVAGYPALSEALFAS